jgi:ferredoxin
VAIEIRVDEGRCASAMRCVYLAPDLFELDRRGVAQVRDPHALPDDEAIAVARQCPNDAIVVVRDGEIVVGGESL